MSRLLRQLARSLLLASLVPSALPAASVQFIGLQDQVEAAPSLPAVFGSREQGCDLAIAGTGPQDGSLHAASFQISGELTMPLQADIDLKDGISFPDGSPQKVHVSIKFPEVRQRTEILYRLSLLPSGPGAKAMPLGDLRFEVFPPEITKELGDLLAIKPDHPPLAVLFGPGQKLRHILASLHVPFEDNGSELPDNLDPSRLYFGELNAEEQFQQVQDRGAGARIAVFSPTESLPSGVYSDRSSSGISIRVTTPLLDNFNDDPRAQLALIKIVHLLSSQPAPAN